ncbi:MAG TPA: hypothetical protein DDW18_03220 [Firmicutes bacterium]|nr:hypothetical protein [Bacillota bacterium]HBN00843.1 hypothetical protein [Bacillota bacterium]
MNREEIKQNIVAILKENLDEFQNTDIQESTVINTDAALDSMRFIYVMTKIESTFGISVPEKKWAKLQTLGDAIDAVEEELAKKK